jgi:hypothetical protein
VLDSVKLKSIVYGPSQTWKTKHSNAVSNDGRDRVYKLGKKAKAEEDAAASASAGNAVAEQEYSNSASAHGLPEHYFAEANKRADDI